MCNVAQMEVEEEKPTGRFRRKRSNGSYKPAGKWPEHWKDQVNEEEIEQQHKQEETPKMAWSVIKKQVPLYQWNQAHGDKQCVLGDDALVHKLSDAQKSYAITTSRGTKRKRLPFPWRLWEPAAWWWQQLRWTCMDSEREYGSSLASHQVSFMELVIDFEISTGFRCDRHNVQEHTWGTKAETLAKRIEMLTEVRKSSMGELKAGFGKSNKVTSLAPFGARNVVGLKRRPAFVAGMATIRCIATNAFRAGQKRAETGVTLPDSTKRTEFVNATVELTGYGGNVSYVDRHQEKLRATLKFAERQGVPGRRLHVKTTFEGVAAPEVRGTNQETTQHN